MKNFTIIFFALVVGRLLFLSPADAQPPLQTIEQTVGNQKKPAIEESKAADDATSDTNSLVFARQLAEQDSAAEHDWYTWRLVGVCFGGFGIAAGHFWSTTPNPLRLTGKSPEWIMEYSRVYRQSTQNRRRNDALIGCVPLSLKVSVGF
ncbi:hypothetical protein C6495_03515 [Candidatus Poribacteria bacterium]|nr:MAG: hypothetical protein C6495_03515 [Candidatus Poribacteria bacterium]